MVRRFLWGVAVKENLFPERRFLKTGEVCKALHIHPNTLRAWSKTGVITAHRTGERANRTYRVIDVMKLLREEKPKRKGE